MSFERSWPEVPPTAFTIDGGQWGLVTVPDTAGFRVKQSAYLTSNALPSLPVQVKIVLSSTTLIVGSIDNQIANWKPLDISAYLVADDAKIGAQWQGKNKIGVEDIQKAVYEADPVVAIRTVDVDQYGDFYTSSNPLPVAIDGTINIAQVRVTACDDDPKPGDQHSSIRISDCVNDLKINTDGSINVIVEPVPSPNTIVKSFYDEVIDLASNATSVITTYTVPIDTQTVLQRIHFSGENIGRYDVLINGVTQDTARTMFGGDLTGEFDFSSGNDSGLVLNTGDVIEIQVNNPRPYVGSYEARIQVLEIAL